MTLIKIEPPESVERVLRADARRNQKRVLQAARRCMARKGLDAQIEEIARAAGVGVGAHGRLRPDPAVIAELERRGVSVECLPTDAAVRRYGELDERRTAVALHLTC